MVELEKEDAAKVYTERIKSRALKSLSGTVMTVSMLHVSKLYKIEVHINRSFIEGKSNSCIFSS